VEEGQVFVGLAKSMLSKIDALTTTSKKLVSDVEQDVTQYKHSNAAYVALIRQLHVAIANAGLTYYSQPEGLNEDSDDIGTTAPRSVTMTV
jgi:hypothetical protein